MSTNEQLSFIKMLGEASVKDYIVSGLLPSLMIAQGILESGWGKSELAKSSNNLFGMRGTYNGESVSGKDDDVKNGVRIPVVVPFRKYPSLAESIEDHSHSLMNNTIKVDGKTVKRYQRVIDAKDYKTGAKALYDCGYAGDTEYASKLIRIIEQHKLYEWDEKAKAFKQSVADAKAKAEAYEKAKADAEAKAKADKTHTVVKGDTVYSLAKKYNITVAEIKDLNNLDKNYTIQLGQKLIVKK